MTENALLVELLLREGADVYAARKYNKPPLLLTNNSDIARLLIDYRADCHTHYDYLCSLALFTSGQKKDEYHQYLGSEFLGVCEIKAPAVYGAIGQGANSWCNYLYIIDLEFH